MTSCASVKNKGAEGLTILILDENDQTVTDYELQIQAVKTGKKSSKDTLFLSFTDKRGYAFFTDLPGGSYSISGQKEGYTFILQTPLKGLNPADLLCYRVCSAEYVFDRVEALYKNQDYQTALDFLERLCTQDSPSLQAALSFYRSYAYARMKQKEKAELELAQMLEFKNSAFESLKYYEAIKALLTAED